MGIKENLNIPKLYLIDLYVEKTHVSTGKSKAEIHQEIADKLEIQTPHLRQIRRAKIGSTGFITVEKLLLLAEYFGCTINDLINQDFHSITLSPGAEVSSEDRAGIPFNPIAKS